MRLFADDSIKYLAIYCTDDCNQLQKDLYKLLDWASRWHADKIYASKCYVLSKTYKENHIRHNYHIHGQILENVDQFENLYLGVQFTDNLKWDTHINITAKS